jgi:hypothetical protein
VSNNKTVVDNWTLELAAKILEGEESFSAADNSRLRDEEQYNSLVASRLESYIDGPVTRSNVWISKSPESYSDVQESIRYEMVLSLFQLLDLIVMYDTLVVDTELTSTWERFEYMEKLSSMVSKVRLGNETKEKIRSTLRYTPLDNTLPIVSEGALYYMGLANMLGLDYWASPKRAKFLSKNVYSGLKKGFVTTLGQLVDEKLDALVRGLIENAHLQDLNGTLYFPGFGAAILSQCNTRMEILQVAIDFRQSRECVAFRNWLEEMDEATTKGDLMFISRNIRDLQEVISSIDRNLSGVGAFRGRVELEIGLSPSLKFGTESINTIVELLKPKQLHLSFLRHHFYRVLERSNLWYQIWRLFPELRFL